MKLKVSDKFSLPLEAASDEIAIVGRRGRGKTTTAVVLVEEIHRSGGRFVVADPVGVWWGLKSTRDGKGKGIPVIVMGGEHADVPLEETSGKVIADFVIDSTNPSVILDFRGFRKAQMTRFMVDFLEQLYHKNRQPLHVVLDEADQFAPQRVMGETARLVGATEDVCKMGRARGLFPIVVTQRPAALNKNVLTQAGLLITHQLTGPQDRKALDDWIRANAEEKERETFISTVPTLPKGVAYFWLPENGVFERVAVRDRHTYDSSSTPKSGAVHGPKVQAEVDLDALKQKIAATIEKAKATDPKELQRQIADLKRQITAKPTAVPTVKQKVVKIPALTEAQVKRIEKLIQRFTDTVNKHQESAQEILVEASRQITVIAAILKQLHTPANPVSREKLVTISTPLQAGKTWAQKSIERNGPLPTGEHKILVATAQHTYGITREQATILTGYKTSTRNAYILRLQTRGFLTIGPNDLVIITDTGKDYLGSDFKPLPTGDALREHWLRDLPEGERKVFEAVCGIYPKAAERDWISEITGYKVSTRNAYILRLSTRKLVTTQGNSVRAAQEVFG